VATFDTAFGILPGTFAFVYLGSAASMAGSVLFLLGLADLATAA
jgi:hypothetical protein